jgi:hypothetical protein
MNIRSKKSGMTPEEGFNFHGNDRELKCGSRGLAILEVSDTQRENIFAYGC